MKYTIKALGIIIIALVVLSGCGDESSQSNDTGNDMNNPEENLGGELHIAVSAQPPTLDPYMSSAGVTNDVTGHIFEGLVAQNEKRQPIPMLADDIDISEDGKTYTFHLREGVPFHNGEEMIAEDVVASMMHWLKTANKAAMLEGATFEVQDDYTVELILPKRMADVLDIMAGRGQYPAIMPEDVIENSDSEGINEYVGTGPFKYVEWKQDQYVHLEKFEDYQPVSEESSGASGKKEALVDDIYFDIVTDPSTRMAGIETGEYDIADSIPYDSYDRMKNMPNIDLNVTLTGTIDLVYNKKSGYMADADMRKAVNTALNMDDIMMANFPEEELYKSHPGYMDPEQEDWSTLKGEEAFNQDDQEKAQHLLEQLNYNGEEIKLMVTRDYDYHYNSAVVIKEQLEQAGMNVELEVFDWATLQERREKPENWDLIVLSTGYATTPTQLLPLDPSWGGWTDDPEITDYLEEIVNAEDQEAAKVIWEELQDYLWMDYLPISILGHYTKIVATSDKVSGFDVLSGPILWNTTVSE